MTETTQAPLTLELLNPKSDRPLAIFYQDGDAVARLALRLDRASPMPGDARRYELFVLGVTPGNYIWVFLCSVNKTPAHLWQSLLNKFTITARTRRDLILAVLKLALSEGKIKLSDYDTG